MKKKLTSKKAKEILDDPFYRLERNRDGKFDELKEIFRDFRDQILTKIDKVIGELEIHRIEQDGIKHNIKDLKKHFSN